MARKRRGLMPLIVGGVLVVLLVVAYFIIDSGVRSFAEDRVEKEIANAMPDSVTGDVAVSIGGTSVIAQFLTGSFDHVELNAPHLTADGVPAAVHVVATGVPTSLGKTIKHVQGTVDLAPEALNALIQKDGTLPDGTLELGNDSVSFTGTLPLPGLPIGYRAEATPTTADNNLVFTPTSAKLTTPLGNLDGSRIVDLILGQQPLRLCLAKDIPAALTLTDVNVSPERARITLESSTLKLSKQSLTTLGTCPA